MNVPELDHRPARVKSQGRATEVVTEKREAPVALRV